MYLLDIRFQVTIPLLMGAPYPHYYRVQLESLTFGEKRLDINAGEFGR